METLSGTERSITVSISFLDHRDNFLKFFFGNFEDQFVVDLHDHLGGEIEFFYSILDVNHRHLDDIRCGPLERSIDRHPLRGLSDGQGWGVNVRKIATAMQKGCHISLLPGLFQTLFNIGLNPGIFFEIFINIGLGHLGLCPNCCERP